MSESANGVGRPRKSAPLSTRLALLAVSSLMALGATELFLRTMHPVYGHAAGSALERDAARVWRSPRDRRVQYTHPDTDRPHWVYFNSQGMRQRRDPDPAELDGALNIGVFGDSYVSNVRLPEPVGFPEVLHHLLRREEPRANVLNFGVNGYGPGQSYLTYRATPLAKELDYVLYVFCSNDLRNIYETGLFSLDSRGELAAAHPAADSQWYVRLLARLHLTYLVIDARNRLTSSEVDTTSLLEDLQHRAWKERLRSPKALSISKTLEPSGDPDSERSVAVFWKLLERWRSEVELSGARFVVVTLPRRKEALAGRALAERFEVINLLDLAREASPDYRWIDIRFANDVHWNERGNLLATRLLYRWLERDLGWQPLDDQVLGQRLRSHYARVPGLWQPGD